MTKGKRGLKFTIAEIESLLKVIDEIIPIGNLEWEWVWDRHASCYPRQEWTAKLLRCKFQQLAHKKCLQVTQIVCLTFVLQNAFE
jgi:hypothetical protein